MPLLFGVMDSAGGAPLGPSISTTSLYSLMSVNGTSTSTTTPTAGGTLTINGNSLSSYDYTVKSGNQTVSSFTASDWFTNTQDTRSALIVVKGDLTINSGQTFTPSVRKLFTCIYVQGNLVVNGTISMTARGANHSGDATSGGYVAPAELRLANGTLSSVSNPSIPATGGAALTVITASAGVTGNLGSNGGSGGGGSGGHGAGGNNNGGAAGTAFSGGPGGGGGYGGGDIGGTTGADSFFAGQANGGRGGGGGDSNSTVTGGGGAGNPGGLAWNSTNYPSAASNSQAVNGANGTGGTLIIIVEGTISGSGSIVSLGSAGGNAQWISGGTSSPNNWVHAGGGSGGGSVNILTRTNSFAGAVSASGGNGGSALSGAASRSDNGGPGGAGTARTLVLTGTPV